MAPKEKNKEKNGFVVTQNPMLSKLQGMKLWKGQNLKNKANNTKSPCDIKNYKKNVIMLCN